MGVSHSLELIDPSTYNWLTLELPTLYSGSEEDLKKIFAVSNKIVDSYFVETFLEIRQTEDPAKMSSVLNHLLAILVSKQSWDLNKSLQAFEQVFELSEMKPLKKMTQFRDFDVPIPQNLLPGDSGLFGIWSCEKLIDCLKPIAMFSTKESCDEYFANLRFSPLQKLFGRQKRTQIAINTLKDEYIWEKWLRISEAITTTVQMKFCLGIVMSC